MKTYNNYIEENGGWIQKIFNETNTETSKTFEFFLLRHYIEYLQASGQSKKINYNDYYILLNYLHSMHRFPYNERKEELSRNLIFNHIENINWILKKYYEKKIFILRIFRSVYMLHFRKLNLQNLKK